MKMAARKSLFSRHFSTLQSSSTLGNETASVHPAKFQLNPPLTAKGLERFEVFIFLLLFD
jgi:hypothetical protein